MAGGYRHHDYCHREFYEVCRNEKVKANNMLIFDERDTGGHFIVSLGKPYDKESTSNACCGWAAKLEAINDIIRERKRSNPLKGKAY